jgi:hypothetical protein
MRKDILTALFMGRLKELNIGIESPVAVDALMAYLVKASNSEALGILAEGMAQTALLPADEEAYFKFINERDGVAAILAKAKAENKLDPILKIGISPFQDRQIYAEYMEDVKSGYFEPRAPRYSEESEDHGTLAEINARFDAIK